MTTDERRELLCNIQGPMAARLIAITQSSFAAGLLYEHHINFSAIFSADLPLSRQPAGNGRPPPSPCASHSEVSGDWERGNLTKCESKFASPQSSPSKSCNDLSRTVLVPNLCSYKRLANGAGFGD